MLLPVVYLFSSSTSHNCRQFTKHTCQVVYLFSSSTSHNSRAPRNLRNVLYISSLLQQATTAFRCTLRAARLYISSLLQQATTSLQACSIVQCCISLLFFNKPQPRCRPPTATRSCISLLFFNKPQLSVVNTSCVYCCISLLFFNKPQPAAQLYMVDIVVYLFSSSTSHNI